ncbi:replicative DNA helicase [Streptomyces variabilis]
MTDNVPHNFGAEQSVLGGMLLAKDAIGDVIDVVKATDFYKPHHQTIFQTILDTYAKGEPADPLTIAAELTRQGEITKVGGPAYLHALVQTVPTAANAAYYAEIVRDTAAFRRLHSAGLHITQLGAQSHGDIGQAAATATHTLETALTTHGQAAEGQFIGDAYEDWLDDLEARRTTNQITGIPTGFQDLDNLTGGLRPGQMIIIAARPGIGKSTLALDIARAAAIHHKQPTAFFSLEMSRHELMDRVSAAEATVALHHIRSGHLTDADWARIATHTPAVTAAPLYIDDVAGRTLASIRAECRRLQQRHGLKLVIIDYLQLLESGTSRRRDNRQQEVSEISRGVKLMAKELGLPVVILSQLNRGPEQRTDKKPVLSDLRESGSLEQDADIVILLHREDAYEKESARAGEADVIFAKHRNGSTATVTVAFQGHYARFHDMTRP